MKSFIKNTVGIVAVIAMVSVGTVFAWDVNAKRECVAWQQDPSTMPSHDWAQEQCDFYGIAVAK